jgi:RNA polymerase sigma-70 factor, ECF subfamily
MNNNIDKEIIELFRDKNQKEEAFKILINNYSKPLYSQIRKILISHEDSNDVLQDTFIKIFKNLDKFRGDSELFTWLYRIATNEAINFINSKKRSYTFSSITYEDTLVNKLTADEFFDGDEIQILLQKAILKLPTKQRLVFNMKYFEEMKYEDIAKILDTSVGALKASYHHAVKKIEKYLSDN